MSESLTPAIEKPLTRIGSIDAYRGFVMFLMMAEVLHLCKVAKEFPDNAVWKGLCYHQSHVEWVGCSLHDLIQPSFSFLVGVALPFSLASRRSRGQSTLRMTLHAFWRALLLASLGIFLRSMNRNQTNFTFEDTLTQIGLGYGFLYLLGMAPARVQWGAWLLILVGYWGAFALYPLPTADFDWKGAGVSPDWPHNATGFAAHWNKNTNLARAFDTWFMNLFPREKPYLHNTGGYQTLSFIPTLATMILGLIAGNWLKSPEPNKRLPLRFMLVGMGGLLIGTGLNELGICPNVKRIWTPAWVCFSGGWCFILLTLFHLVVDRPGLRRLLFPLFVIGANSIAAYCMDWLFAEFIRKALYRHLPEGTFGLFGTELIPLVEGAAVLLVLWAILYWMFRSRIHIRI